jgi:acyl-CoA synthetase (AMP-forming)/AMP-acid ligase II
MHVGHLLTRAALQYPDRPAWMDGAVLIDYRTAEARVNRLANALLGCGMRPGDRVGLLSANCYQAIETILAPMKAGMAVVPMNARLHPEEHAFILDDSECAALIYGAEFADHLGSVRDRLSTVRHFIRVGGPGAPDLEYESVLAAADSAVPPAEPRPDDLAWIFYTSGTTGKPKGAMLTHRNLLAMEATFLVETNPAVSTDVLLHAAPITHGSGLAMFHHIARGAAQTFLPTRRFDPTAVFRTIERFGVTTIELLPTMIIMLLAAPDRPRYRLGSLHTILYGGSPMPVEKLREAMDAFGPVFVQIYGLGEAPQNITTLRREEHVGERLASAGRPTTNMMVRIQDDDWESLPPGETGEIAVRGEIVMAGYWKRPDATADVMRHGWFRTGDIGRLDAEGYLYISDRKKEMIISGGANIYPREVEEVIYQHPAVHEAAVIGVPDAKWGEAVKALVVLKPGARATEQEIVEHCRARIASYKKPQSVEFRASLPKSGYGKILRRELREPYWAGRERNI